jgi:hypothetical protein
MDRDEALALLPVPYATALSLLDQGISRHEIALRLGIDHDAIVPFFALAESKLASIQRGSETNSDGDSRASDPMSS